MGECDSDNFLEDEHGAEHMTKVGRPAFIAGNR